MTKNKIVPFAQTVLGKLRLHLRLIFFIAGAIVLCLFIWAIFAPQALTYDFGQKQTCQNSPRFLPGLSKIEQKAPFTVKRPASLSVGKLSLYASRICVTATAAPMASATVSHRERLFGWSLFGRDIRIRTPGYPKFSNQTKDRQSLPPDGVFRLDLDRADATFSYILKANDRSAACTVKQKAVSCNMVPLQLGYAKPYDIQLVRRFAAKEIASAATVPIQTITPTNIINTSIPAGSSVQQKPTELVLQSDKDITALGTVSLVSKNANGSEATIPVAATANAKTITVKLGQELVRKTQFELRIASLKAADGSGLAAKSYTLPFSTSGGPKVTGANIGTRSVALGQTITLNLDQDLLAGQDIGAQVTFTVHGKPQPAVFSVTGNKLHINPSADLPLCAPFSVKINSGIQNLYGVSGDSAWSINSRTICYTTFSIGASVKGRAITAYKFGTGDNPIIYMGAMHGDEVNSKNLMTEWFNELNANPGRLPGRSLVVIPAVSPDGVVARSRLNARGVDLNRNFPATDWKTMVTSPESPNPTPAGGPQPLSEPESAAVASYIRQTRPRAVFSFHSSAAVVEANEAGDSVSIAQTYASKARYRAVPKSQSASVFKYDTTGAMEDWMRSSLGLPAIVVELLSDTSSEFSRNRDALWYSTGL
jgi:hypothetical protein